MGLLQQPVSMEALLSPLSSRPQRRGRDLQFSGPFLEMSFDKAICPGDAVEAQWRDLRFSSGCQEGDACWAADGRVLAGEG